MNEIHYKHNFNSFGEGLPEQGNQDLSAISIQKMWRGHVARRACLSNPSYAIYQAQCRAVLEGHAMPEASSGNTHVFFPPATPSIILKQSGKRNAIQRFSDMQTVRGILRSQKSSHLVIPRASLCGDFLVEDRLPISSDRYVNMARYIDHPRMFDEAIREMTRLFSRAWLTDLVSSHYHPISNIVGDTVRYDNVPLYIENGVGKIGLIDLEHISYYPFSSKNRPSGSSAYTSPAQTLARIFPYHVDMIIEESNKLNMKFNENQVRFYAREGHEFLQKGYIDHLNWLRQKEITPEKFNQPFEVTPDRIETIVQTLTEQLLSRNISWLTEESIAESVHSVISDIEKVLLDTVNRPSTVDTDTDLVLFRSPTFKRDRLESNTWDHFKKLLPPSPNSRDYYSQLGKSVDALIEGTCNELVKGGELFSYDPNYGSGAYPLSWLRY